MKQTKLFPLIKQPEPQLYFAYGSNLDQNQMRRRCPSAVAIGKARLNGWVLAFGGHSALWGGAVATLLPVKHAYVYGLVYEMLPADVERLDRFEGCPISYVRRSRQVRMRTRGGPKRSAFLYLQRPDIALRAPAPDYLRVIQRAYQELGFPEGMTPWGMT